MSVCATPVENAEDEWVSKVEWHRVAIIWNLDLRQMANQV